MACKSKFALTFFLLCISGLVQAQLANAKVFNIEDYGAVNNGKSDNTKALGNAWKEACQSSGDSVLLIPEGTYILKQLVLQGPCRGALDFELKGVLKAPADLYSSTPDPWIAVRYVNNLTLTGGGSIDGHGAKAWEECLINHNCNNRPSASMNFDFVNNSRIHDINFVNSEKKHMKIFGSNNMNVHDINITAPGQESVNTDGIYIAASTNIQITNSNISTGDDCIAFGPGSKNINITNVSCGPGHGISIGSLGGSPNELGVDGIRVSGCTFTGTTNGVRIKTWASPYHSIVSNITFEDIQMNNVSNPIIIEQNYCPSKTCDPKGQSNIEIHDVVFNNIWGSSYTQVAVELQCSKIKPCKNIQLTDINLDYITDGESTESMCSNVRVITKGKQNPSTCS